MADTVTATGLRVQQWDNRFNVEYLTENRYFPGMGVGSNSVIEMREDITKRPGDSVTFALVNRLRQSAVIGSAMMEGNEEDMSTRSFLRWSRSNPRSTFATPPAAPSKSGR
jgi:hypothetical protein